MARASTESGTWPRSPSLAATSLRASRGAWRSRRSGSWGSQAGIERRWGARGRMLAAMLEAGVNAPQATGCGRWFDAACGILGVRDRSGYEAEAPMVLESLVRSPRVVPGTWRVEGGVLDLLPLLDALRGMTPEGGADAFHGTLAAALVESRAPGSRGGAHDRLGGGLPGQRGARSVPRPGLRRAWRPHAHAARRPGGRRWPCARTGLGVRPGNRREQLKCVSQYRQRWSR